MDKKNFKSAPYHVKKKHNGEIDKTVFSSNTEVGAPSSPAELHVYGTARFEDPALAANALIFGHRLSVSGSSSVPTENVPSASVLYLTPHTSEFVGLYMDDHWGVKQVTMLTKSLELATRTNTNHDVFAFWDQNRKTVDLEFLAWSSDRIRATELGRKDGVFVKQGDPSRRYVGTFRTITAGVTADASSRRFVWNYHNRVERLLQQPIESATSWTYAGTAFRAANGQTANSFEVVTGDFELVAASAQTTVAGSSGFRASLGIGVNSTTVNSAQVYGGLANGAYGLARSEYGDIPTPGYNRFYWLEATSGTSATFYGNATDTFYHNAGIMGRVRG